MRDTILIEKKNNKTINLILLLVSDHSLEKNRKNAINTSMAYEFLLLKSAKFGMQSQKSLKNQQSSLFKMIFRTMQLTFREIR